MSQRKLSPGFRVGHWTNEAARTGCTIILPPLPNVCSCDVRGASPSSRELELLHPDRKLTEIHGLLLTGGSAFGLGAAQGVVQWLEQKGIGYDAGVARVPIVPAAVIFDLGTERADVRPGPTEGLAACEIASESLETGHVGAGTGATVGKWAGREFASRGGLGAFTARHKDVSVSALAVVNSVGDVIGSDGSVVAGTRAENPIRQTAWTDEPAPSNTVLAVVTVEANLGKRSVRWLAARGSDGITVSVRPAHTRYDGDVVFAIASPTAGRGEADLDLLGYLATEAVAGAVRQAVTEPE
jgi:L-aminopeptidase/D-esterase-like protein